jgi:hypothetical protein
MTPRERAKIIVQQLYGTTLRSRTALIETAIRDAENDILARVSERLKSQSDPLTPASAAAIARELIPGFVRPRLGLERWIFLNVASAVCR